jgi:hypothetical protein
MVDIVAAVIGVVLGSIITWFYERRKHKEELERLEAELKQTSRQHLLDEPRLEAAKELLEFLSLVLNREAPAKLKKKVPELKRQWAKLSRHLFLLHAADDERYMFDERMVQYLNTLKNLANDPSVGPDVEMQRELTKKEARGFLKRLGLVADW